MGKVQVQVQGQGEGERALLMRSGCMGRAVHGKGPCLFSRRQPPASRRNPDRRLTLALALTLTPTLILTPTLTPTATPALALVTQWALATHVLDAASGRRAIGRLGLWRRVGRWRGRRWRDRSWASSACVCGRRLRRRGASRRWWCGVEGDVACA